ncbi:hypothetical protein ACJIZ3_014369 [Penstemon smallii]|uniref:Uncharacterized protein n=1 Tax=Penstemon smallii TaxID=265156 RepID=A0ABD3RQZ0_9LAMI
MLNEQPHEDTALIESIRRGKRIRTENGNHPLESHSNGIDNGIHDNTYDRGKIGRGPTNMARVWARKIRKEVEFDELGHPIGPNKIRNGAYLPIDTPDWHTVSDGTKNELLELVKVILRYLHLYLSATSNFL